MAQVAERKAAQAAEQAKLEAENPWSPFDYRGDLSGNVFHAFTVPVHTIFMIGNDFAVIVFILTECSNIGQLCSKRFLHYGAALTEIPPVPDKENASFFSALMLYTSLLC